MRDLNTIAQDIAVNWGLAKVHYAAVPYLQAMAQLGDINSTYGCDSAKSIVRYFLSNASSWRGDAARRIKAELRSMV